MICNMLRSTSTRQGLIALSSGESEFYDLEQSQCSKTWELTSARTKIDKAVLEVRVATAGRGIAVRRGDGRIRHIATPLLGVQKLTQNGIVKNTKNPGAWNLADLGAKHLHGGSIRRALERCHFYIHEGRAGIALRDVREIM